MRFSNDRFVSFLTAFCNKVFVSDLINFTVSRTSFRVTPSRLTPTAAWGIPPGLGLLILFWIRLTFCWRSVNACLKGFLEVSSEEERFRSLTHSFESSATCPCWNWSLDWCLEFEQHPSEDSIQPLRRTRMTCFSSQMRFTCPAICACWPVPLEAIRSTRPRSSAIFWSILTNEVRIWSWPSKIVRNSRSYSLSN